MKKKDKGIMGILLFVVLGLLVFLFSKSNVMVLLHPKGMIALQERDLMITATLLSFIVIIPVCILIFFIGWKYRASNTAAKYTPNWDTNILAECIWWTIPCIIIFVLGVITWRSTHELDPFKPLVSKTKPLRIQVIALQWKWLFIYPEQHIATVNFFQFPQQTPINFEITADAPMNSFWIPALGGQVYAMSGMSTQLHLIADSVGEYRGSSANLSGAGFSGMKFIAKSSSVSDFDHWVDAVKRSTKTLSLEEYTTLAKPSTENIATYYSSTQKDLYTTIVMKFMMPQRELPSMSTHHSMDMNHK